MVRRLRSYILLTICEFVNAYLLCGHVLGLTMLELYYKVIFIGKKEIYMLKNMKEALLVSVAVMLVILSIGFSTSKEWQKA